MNWGKLAIPLLLLDSAAPVQLAGGRGHTEHFIFGGRNSLLVNVSLMKHSASSGDSDSCPVIKWRSFSSGKGASRWRKIQFLPLWLSSCSSSWGTLILLHVPISFWDRHLLLDIQHPKRSISWRSTPYLFLHLNPHLLNK